MTKKTDFVPGKEEPIFTPDRAGAVSPEPLETALGEMGMGYLTLRDLAAFLAMPHLNFHLDPGGAAKLAYKAADALLVERGKTQ